MPTAIEVRTCACGLDMRSHHGAFMCPNCDFLQDIQTLCPHCGTGSGRCKRTEPFNRVRTQADHRFELEWKRRIRRLYPNQPLRII